MQFDFLTAGHIIFGSGTLPRMEQLAPQYGWHALVVTTKDVNRASRLFGYLKAANVAYTPFPIDGEPTIGMARNGAEMARSQRVSMVIGFGGGSVIDTGKAIAALAANPGDPLDYLEVIGKGQPLQNDPLPFIAIPTTAGTGAEVTKNAVLKSETHNVKVSLRHNKMLPAVALIDPELTHSVPPDVTAYTGMDALTQVMEPYVSRMANPMTDALCIEGLRRAGRSLRRVYAQPDDPTAREDMALVSLFGGLALANAKLGAVHGFAGTLGGMYDAPHGAICAALLPHVMTVNLAAMQARDPDNVAAVRYDELGAILGGEHEAAVDWVKDTASRLHIQSLSKFGVQSQHFPDIIAQSKQSSSMKGNPITLTDSELTEILTRAL